MPPTALVVAPKFFGRGRLIEFEFFGEKPEQQFCQGRERDAVRAAHLREEPIAPSEEGPERRTGVCRSISLSPRRGEGPGEGWTFVPDERRRFHKVPAVAHKVQI